MVALNFLVDTDPDEYPEISGSGRVNAYVETPSKDGSRPATVKATPGADVFADTGAFNSRGSIALDDVVYFVMEGGTFKIEADGTVTNVGDISGTGRVAIERNSAVPPQIGIVDQAGRFFVLTEDVIERVPTEDLPAFNSVAFLNQVLILGVDDGRMFSTALADAKSINGLDFATAEARPDGLVRVAVLGNELYAFGVYTTEVWTPNGSSIGFPFSPITSGYIKKGLSARWSVQELDSTLYFIGSDRGNDHKVYRLNGYSAEPMSNRAVERDIEADPNRADIESYSYSIAGHTFYGIQGTGWTWEYSLTSGFWHPRKSPGRETWRGKNTVAAFNGVLFGEVDTGRIFKVNQGSRLEAGEMIQVEAIAAPVSSIPDRAVMNKLQFGIVTGRAPEYATEETFRIGGTGGIFLADAPGVALIERPAQVANATTADPKILVDWSFDGGVRWSNVRTLKLGRKGDRVKYVATNVLGSTRKNGNVIFRARLSDPHVFGLASGDLMVEAL